MNPLLDKPTLMPEEPKILAGESTNQDTSRRHFADIEIRQVEFTDLRSDISAISLDMPLIEIVRHLKIEIRSRIVNPVIGETTSESKV